MLFVCTVVFSQGHYNGSSFNPNDYFAPHPGWIVPVWYGYANMNYYNGSGQKSDQLINPAPDNPTALSISQNVKTDSFILMAIYGGKGKILSDRIAGIGGYGSYWIVPKKIVLMGRITQNFAAENRFAGTAVQVGVNFLFSSEEH